MDTNKTEKMFVLVDQWKASGMTQKAFCQQIFCQQIELKVATFAYWVAKKKRTEEPAGGFALVELTGASSGRQVEITYPNGVRLLLGHGDLALIGQLINFY